VAAKTGNIYISGTMTYMTEIPNANLGLSTTLSSNSLDDYWDNDRQPGIAT